MPFQLLYLVSFLALPVWTFSLGSLLFEFIERVFPDALQYRGDLFFGGMRNSIAALLIAFPLYMFFMWRLWKEATQKPEQLQSKVRQWFTYIVLAVVAAVILGDCIALLSHFLGGELVLRFFLKAFTILAIACAVFGYYLFELKRSAQAPAPNIVRLSVFGLIGIVVGTVALALFFMGSPAKQRALQFDARRVSDLQQISYAIEAYWEINKKLPQSFEELKRVPHLYIESVHDPITEASYEYRTIDEKSYELCAVFATNSKEQAKRAKIAPPFSEEIWEHDAGRTCFAREVVVNKDLKPGL